MSKVLTNTVVADAAVGRARRAEDFAGVAVLQLDDLVVDLNVADSRRRSLASGDVHVGSLWKHSLPYISAGWCLYVESLPSCFHYFVECRAFNY